MIDKYRQRPSAIMLLGFIVLAVVIGGIELVGCVADALSNRL